MERKISCEFNTACVVQSIEIMLPSAYFTSRVEYEVAKNMYEASELD